MSSNSQQFIDPADSERELRAQLEEARKAVCEMAVEAKHAVRLAEMAREEVADLQQAMLRMEQEHSEREGRLKSELEQAVAGRRVAESAYKRLLQEQVEREAFAFESSSGESTGRFDQPSQPHYELLQSTSNKLIAKLQSDLQSTTRQLRRSQAICHALTQLLPSHHHPTAPSQLHQTLLEYEHYVAVLQRKNELLQQLLR